MSKIIENRQLSDDFYLMVVEEKNQAKMGEFYMLRAWDTYPVLSRPISVLDADENTLSFLYKVVGEGTRYFAKLQAGDEIILDGPHGTGYPTAHGRIALVGGGVGIAPLYLTAKKLKEFDPENKVDIYLGFSGQPVMEKEFEGVCDNLIVNVGGYITDDIQPKDYDTVMTCGPEIMMRLLYEKCERENPEIPVYVSLENRMACGIGACLVCTCKTTKGNKRACKEGPVLLGSEVYGK